MCGRPRRPPRARERGAPPLAGSTRVRGALHFSRLELKVSKSIYHIITCRARTETDPEKVHARGLVVRGRERAQLAHTRTLVCTFATASLSPSRVVSVACHVAHERKGKREVKAKQSQKRARRNCGSGEQAARRPSSIGEVSWGWLGAWLHVSLLRNLISLRVYRE